MALEFVRGQLIDAIINADKLDANAVVEAKIDNGAVAFAKLKGADVTSDLEASATSSQIARADAIKQYVDDEIADLANNAWKEACVASSTAQLSATYSHANGTITATANGAFDIDSVGASNFSLGDRILVRHATSAGATGTENCGIYNITTLGDGSNPYVLTRAEDMNSGDEVRGSAVLVLRGTVNYGRAYYVPSFAGIWGTDNVIFERFKQIAAGDGLQISGENGPQDDFELNIASSKAIQIVSTQLDLVLDGGTLAQSATGLKVDAAGITATELNTSVAGAGISGGGGTALAVDLATDSGLQLDGSDQLSVLLKSEAGGTISKDSSGLFIADNEIGNNKLANDSISGKALGTNLDSLSASDGISMTSYNGSASVSDLTVQLDGSTLSKSGAGVKVADEGIDTSQLADGSVETAKLDDDAVDLRKLGITPDTSIFTATAGQTSFVLDNRIDQTELNDFLLMVRAFRNGQRLKPVESSPADASEYTISDNGSATVVTLGSGITAGEVVIVDYWY